MKSCQCAIYERRSNSFTPAFIALTRKGHPPCCAGVRQFGKDCCDVSPEWFQQIYRQPIRVYSPDFRQDSLCLNHIQNANTVVPHRLQLQGLSQWWIGGALMAVPLWLSRAGLLFESDMVTVIFKNPP